MLIVKFLLFGMPRIIPLVLPLSVLLASIMTFGNLAENYEFAAMKSAGISLQRTMKRLTIFIVFLSVLAFVFANNVIPYAEYKFINFRKNIAQRKPAMAIAEGQFSEIGYYTIKVDKKSGENGNHLTGITIHKKSLRGDGVRTVIKSKDGDLISNENTKHTSLKFAKYKNKFNHINNNNREHNNRDQSQQALVKRDKIPIALNNNINNNHHNS